MSDSNLHVRPSPDGKAGQVLDITPESAGWEYTGFELFKLEAGAVLDRSNADREFCAVVISGAAEFACGGQTFATGERKSPFDPQAWAFYTSRDTDWSVAALAPLQLALCSAPGRKVRPVRFVTPDDVTVERRGEGANTRYVTDLMPEDDDMADSLLVLEARTPSGCWSSYPPHKHDQDALPEESKLEEVYFYRIEPSSGFALQRVYTDDGSLDRTFAVKDGEVVLVPYGYHPVGAPHGYELYYLNVMAGPKRIWRTRPDPQHAWLLKP